MSGSRSTRSWLYENRPRTQSAAITIVAKTGLAIETRVNHMGDPSRRGCRRGEAARSATGAADADADGDDPAGADAARRRVGDAALRDDLGRRALLEVVEADGEDLRIGAEPLDDLDPAARRVAPAGDDDAAHQRALLDRPDEVLPRRLADGAARHRHPLGRVGELDARLRVLAGAEALALVLERDDDADRARSGLGGGRDAVDAAGDVAALPFDADRRDLARLEHRHLVRADRCRRARATTGRRR